MTPRGPSRTAVLTSAARALHREEPPPWVLDDELALRLAGADGLVLKDRLRAEVPLESLLGFSRWCCVRARLPEDTVEAASAASAIQYVILGAGLDTFAYRRPDLAGRIRVIEVDHPASQAWKRDRLEAVGIPIPRHLTFAPIDFETETLTAALEAAEFDRGMKTVFGWIGVTMYLTLEAIRSTLSAVTHSTPGSQIVLTYNIPRDRMDPRWAAGDLILRETASDLGEPFVSLFAPGDMERLMAELGFVDIEPFGPREAVERYFAGRSDVDFSGTQRLVTGTVPG